jgi:hypothetical protein
LTAAGRSSVGTTAVGVMGWTVLANGNGSQLGAFTSFAGERTRTATAATHSNHTHAFAGLVAQEPLLTHLS